MSQFTVEAARGNFPYGTLLRPPMDYSMVAQVCCSSRAAPQLRKHSREAGWGRGKRVVRGKASQCGDVVLLLRRAPRVKKTGVAGMAGVRRKPCGVERGAVT